MENPGFQHFILKPGVVDDPSLTWVKAHHDSIYGRIVSNWSLDKDRNLTMQVTVPPNTTATLYLPTADEKTVTESGAPLAEAQGLQPAGLQTGHLRIELQPGAYTFRSTLVGLGKL